MWFEIVLSSGITLAVAATIGTVFREAIARWISQRIQHESDRKLELLRHDLSDQSARLSSELDAKQRQIERLAQLVTIGRNIR